MYTYYAHIYIYIYVTPIYIYIYKCVCIYIYIYMECSIVEHSGRSPQDGGGCRIQRSPCQDLLHTWSIYDVIDDGTVRLRLTSAHQ